MRAFTLLAAVGIASIPVFGQRTPSQQPSQLFTITISPLKEEIKAGTEVMIKVRLTNVSSQDILAGSGYHAQGLDMRRVAQRQCGVPHPSFERCGFCLSSCFSLLSVTRPPKPGNRQAALATTQPRP
jgi:hypothetical protein